MTNIYDKESDYLRPGERLDDLERNGYRIIQNREKFCFGMDAVLLSWFAKVEEGEVAIDLGTGTGIIPILLKARTKGEHFTGLEIQEDMAEMAGRSVKYNNLENDIEIVTGDIKEASHIFRKASFDVVTSNPPYMNDTHGLKNPDEAKAISRHEVLCTLEDVIENATILLKPMGRFYMIHRPHRLVEIIEVMKNKNLMPKRMRFVHPYADKDANMVLIEGIRGGKPMMKLEAPIIVYKGVNEYTDQIKKIYQE